MNKNSGAHHGTSAFQNDVGGEFVSTLEEYDENLGATDVELEQDPDGDLESDSRGGERENIENPWDPRKIRVGTKSFSLRNMLDQIDEGSLELVPDFQRLKVWKPRQKARLIESLLLQIPLPAFYFTEEHDGSMRVVDGLQRLSAVREFVRGESDDSGGFVLTDLEYLSDARGQAVRWAVPGVAASHTQRSDRRACDRSTDADAL